MRGGLWGEGDRGTEMGCPGNTVPPFLVAHSLWVRGNKNEMREGMSQLAGLCHPSWRRTSRVWGTEQGPVPADNTVPSVLVAHSLEYVGTTEMKVEVVPAGKNVSSLLVAHSLGRVERRRERSAAVPAGNTVLPLLVAHSLELR